MPNQAWMTNDGQDRGSAAPQCETRRLRLTAHDFQTVCWSDAVSYGCLPRNGRTGHGDNGLFDMGLLFFIYFEPAFPSSPFHRYILFVFVTRVYPFSFPLGRVNNDNNHEHQR